MTGARRGIGLAMAEALAAAGADIVGVSAPTWRPPAARSSSGYARRAAGSPRCAPTSPTAPRCAVSPGDLARARPDRHPGQQRRHDRPRPGGGAPRRDWDHVLEVNLTSQFVLTREIGREMVGPGPREDHLHRVAAELPGRHHRPRLHRREVRHRRPDQGAGQRVGGARGQRQRHRARLHRHRQHPGAAGRPGTQPGHPRPDPGRPVGNARRPRRRHGVPGLARVGLRQRRRPARRRRVAGPMTVPTGPTDIVDAHHHLWVRARHPQPWIDPATMAAIDADFTPADLDRAARDAGVTRTVLVQANSTEAETVDLLGVAADSPLVGRCRRLAGSHRGRRRRPAGPAAGGAGRRTARRRPVPRPGRARPDVPRPGRRRGGRSRRSAPPVSPSTCWSASTNSRRPAGWPATCPRCGSSWTISASPRWAARTSAGGPATCAPSRPRPTRRRNSPAWSPRWATRPGPRRTCDRPWSTPSTRSVRTG